MNSPISSTIGVLALTFVEPACASNANPVTATTHFATAAQKKTSMPDQSTLNKSEKVTFNGVVLLTPEAELQGNVEVSDMVNLITNAEFLARGIFASSTRPGILVLQFDCAPTEQKVNVA